MSWNLFLAALCAGASPSLLPGGFLARLVLTSTHQKGLKCSLDGNVFLSFPLRWVWMQTPAFLVGTQYGDGIWAPSLRSCQFIVCGHRTSRVIFPYFFVCLFAFRFGFLHYILHLGRDWSGVSLHYTKSLFLVSFPASVSRYHALIRAQWFIFFIHQTSGNSGQAGCGSLKVSSSKEGSKFHCPSANKWEDGCVKILWRIVYLPSWWQLRRREQEKTDFSQVVRGQEAWRMPWEFPGLRISWDLFPCSPTGTALWHRSVCEWEMGSPFPGAAGPGLKPSSRA